MLSDEYKPKDGLVAEDGPVRVKNPFPPLTAGRTTDDDSRVAVVLVVVVDVVAMEVAVVVVVCFTGR